MSMSSLNFQDTWICDTWDPIPINMNLKPNIDTKGLNSDGLIDMIRQYENGIPRVLTL